MTELTESQVGDLRLGEIVWVQAGGQWWRYAVPPEDWEEFEWLNRYALVVPD